MSQLTAHFSLDELTFTQHRSLDNTPPADVIEHLKTTAGGLELVRAALGGFGLRINSGYRSPAVNAAVGGAATSAHLTGYAADFVCPNFGDPLACCRAIAGARDRGLLDFDQLIQEGSWVHISFDPRMRGQVLTKAPGGYRPGL